MDKNFSYEIEIATKEHYKKAKKNKEDVSLYTKSNLLKLLNKCKDTKKEEYIYKFRYAILNRDFTNPKLSYIYEKLFNKIISTKEDSVIFTNWDNVFTTIFGNMPVIHDKVGINYIDKIINIFCKTTNENKLKCLMNLFVTIYNIDNLDVIDYILIELNNQENEHILDNYNLIIKNLYKITDNEYLKNYFYYIFSQISNSKNAINSEYLKELLEIFLFNENNFENPYLITLFKIFSESTNMELIYAYHTLITNSEFIKADSVLQNKCILLLKKISEDNFMKIRLVTQIIIDIIIVSDNKEINNYLLNKLLIVKNNETLELILKLEPVLSSFTDDKEFIRVINSLEDKDSNLTKKLVINLNNKE